MVQFVSKDEQILYLIYHAGIHKHISHALGSGVSGGWAIDSVTLRVSADINAAVAANKPHVQELHTLFSELSRRHARTMLYLSEVALHCFPLKD